MTKAYSLKEGLTFKERVFKVVSKIPRGAVMTYKEVAKAAGRPRAYRAVGNILHRNPRPMYGPRQGLSLPIVKDSPWRSNIAIPCHRVVKSDGEVGGYAAGNLRKVRLLKQEGIIIKRGCVENFACYPHHFSRQFDN